MSVIRISLFGQLGVECGGRKVAGLDARKPQELLCYLLLHPDRPHPRETVADALWSSCATTQQCRSYLRKALWQLHAAFEPCQTPAGEPFFLVEPDTVTFQTGGSVWLDVAVLERTYTQVRGLAGAALDAGQIAAVRDAVSLYAGDLLEGWYQEWCLQERERLRHIYLILLDKLVAGCEAHGQWEDGLAYAHHILCKEPARERTHRSVMRLYYRMTDRTSALRQYQRCIAALRQELGVEPGQRTTELYRQIRDDRPLPNPEVAATPPPTLASLADALERLNKLHDLLRTTELEIERNIQEVQQSLNIPR